MKHLITGIAGFAGSHLAEKLVSKNEQIFGLDLPGINIVRIEHLMDRITYYQCDLESYENVVEVLRECNPDYIYHLAAFSHVKKSFESKQLTMKVNFFGAFNLVEAVLESGYKPRILVVGSASQYGKMSEHDPPLTENAPLQPMSPYGLSKTCQEYLAKQYCFSHKMHIVVVRCFNYTGIRQEPDFVCSDFAKQIAEIEKGLREPVIHVGNLDVKRDFTDVSDIMDAFILTLEKGVPGEVYNLCSGNVYSIREILGILLSQTSCSIDIKQDADRFRPSEITYLKGDYSKFSNISGWSPEIPFQSTLKNLLDYWRNQLGAK